MVKVAYDIPANTSGVCCMHACMHCACATSADSERERNSHLAAACCTFLWNRKGASCSADMSHVQVVLFVALLAVEFPSDCSHAVLGYWCFSHERMCFHTFHTHVGLFSGYFISLVILILSFTSKISVDYFFDFIYLFTFPFHVFEFQPCNVQPEVFVFLFWSIDVIFFILFLHEQIYCLVKQMTADAWSTCLLLKQ